MTRVMPRVPTFKDALLRAARRWGGAAALVLGGKYPAHKGYDAWVGGVGTEGEAHRFLGIVAGGEWEDEQA